MTSENEFRQLLDDLESGVATLNRSDLVRRGLRLLSTTHSGNVMAEVQTVIERPPPSISAQPEVEPSIGEGEDASKLAEAKVPDIENGDDETSAIDANTSHPRMHFESTTTVSNSYILSVESTLSNVLSASNDATKESKGSNKHRLLLYRFLLNGLAEISGERQLLMAAAPMFAAEATDVHKRTHSAAIEAVLKGVRLCDNDGLKKALKLVGFASEPSSPVESEKKDEESEETGEGNEDAENKESEPTTATAAPVAADEFARNLCLGLVLYFEQKTNSTIFTVSSQASNTSHSPAPGTSKQGRFFDLVSLLSYIVAEGLKAPTDSDDKPVAEEGTRTQSPNVKSPSAQTEGVFLATLFALLYRLVPIFVPLRGDEHLFRTSAVPDLLRLLIQYHDPVLCLHLDQHPLKKRGSPADDERNNSSTTATVPGINVAPPVVAPAQTLADAGYQYLTGLGSAAAFGESSVDPHVPTSDSLSLLDYLILRYDDAHHIGCLSFIATVMLHRGEILKLTSGGQIAEFWAKFAAGGFGKTAHSVDLGVDAIEAEDIEEKEGDEGNKHRNAVRYATGVLKAQSTRANKARLPPALEAVSGFLLASNGAASQPPFAAVLSVVVSNLVKSTPSSARVFANAILSSTNGGWGAHGTGAGGSSVADQIEQQRAYVASFPVMPVTAEELALVFPAGGVANQVTHSADGEAAVETVHTSASSRAPPSGLDAVASASSHLQYLVLDSRAENSFLFARLPTAIHIGSTIGFDLQQLQSTIQGLQDAWASHLTIMGTGRSIVEELNLLKLISMRLVEKGFPHVSIVDGGFKACIPFLKSGSMEYVQSPQRQREGAAPQQKSSPNQHQDPNVTRTTLASSEEIVGEIASQATVFKDQAAVIGGKAAEQAVVLKDKAAVGLKKTGENLSVAAGTAAVWGAGIWSKLSEKVTTGVASAKDQIQKARDTTTTAGIIPNSGQNDSSSSATTFSPPLAPTNASHSDAPKAGSRPTSTTNFNHQDSSAARLTSDNDAEVFVTTTDDADNDEDLGLILSVAPTSKVSIPPTQSSAARASVLAASPPTSNSNRAGSADNSEILTGTVVGKATAETEEPKPQESEEGKADEAIPAEEAPVPAASSPVAKAPPANTIDDLFDDMVAAPAPTTSASPKATKPAATTAAPKPPTKSTGNTFDDIFGEDF